MKPISLFTIGYENKKIDEFVSILQQFGVRTLIDVRELPISRKAYFSKSKLQEYLEEFNINYIHKKTLGSPKKLRNKLYQDTDYNSFFAEYEEYLETQLNVVTDLYWDIVVHEASCLMCMENDPNVCHRKIVAEKIKGVDGNGLVIKHL